MEIIACDCCGSPAPDSFTQLDAIQGITPEGPCGECGEIAWRIFDVDPSELEGWTDDGELEESGSLDDEECGYGDHDWEGGMCTCCGLSWDEDTW